MPLWGSPTITDDAGAQVPATWFRWGAWRTTDTRESGDAARNELAARMMPDYSGMFRESITRKNLARIATLLLPGALFVVGPMILPGLLPAGLPFPVVIWFMMLASFVYYRWFFAREVRLHQQQAITTALAEGCCAACLYGLRDVDRSHQRTTCPECGARWNTTRIGTLRGALTHEKAIAADEARVGEGVAAQAPRGLSSWFFGDKWMLAPTVVDARGRRVRLVDGRIFARPSSDTRLSESQLQGARHAMAKGRLRAVLFTVSLTAMWTFVLWMQVSLVLKTGMGAGIAGLWQVVVKFFVIVVIPIAFVSLVRQYYPRLRGWKPSRPQPAADALAELSICACCGDPLAAPPQEDGAVECGTCGASWKTGAKAP
jgi:hypothetical protein